MEGNSTQACGENGETCRQCDGDGQICDFATKSCQATPCDSTSCSDGCCTSNGECKRVGRIDQSKSVCGKNGNACEVCDSSDVSCTAGSCVAAETMCLDYCTDGCCMGETCVPFDMQDNASCGKPSGSNAVSCTACTGTQNCAQGGCADGPAYTLTIVSATIAPTDMAGEDWDLFGALPDPEVAGSLGGEGAEDFSTPFEDSTLSPRWNFRTVGYRQIDLVGKGLDLVFTDDDNLSPDDPMGECSFAISQTDLDNGTKTQATCGTKVTDLRIDFTLVD